MRYIENILAVVGLLALIGFALFGIMNLVHRAQVTPPTSYLEPRMTRPVFCDATMTTRGAAPDRWTRPTCYMRKDR